MRDFSRIKYELRIFFNLAESKRLFNLKGIKAFLNALLPNLLIINLLIIFPIVINSQKIIVIIIMMLMRKSKILQENSNGKSSIEGK